MDSTGPRQFPSELMATNNSCSWVPVMSMAANLTTYVPSEEYLWGGVGRERGDTKAGTMMGGMEAQGVSRQAPGSMAKVCFVPSPKSITRQAELLMSSNVSW